MDQLVRLDNRNEGRSFFHLDGLRSTVSLTDGAGGSRQSIFYDAWGNERDRVGSSANNFTFTGHELDKETGLIYAKARFYDAEVGRFLSQDTVLGDVASPPSLHRYFYVMQNPFRYADPTGNQPVCVGPECPGSASPWRDRAISFFDFTVGFSNAFISDLTVGLLPRIEPHLARSEAVLHGQLAGDAAAAGLGALEVAQGVVTTGTGATGGGVALATGVGAPLAIPAGVVAAAGLVQTGHGLLVLNKAVEGQAQTRQELDSRKGQTIKEAPTGDEAVPQPSQKADTGTKPTTESVGTNLEAKAFSSSTSASGPGSAPHKAARWEEYQARGGEWSYERWSKVYESNMTRARQANEAAETYRQQLGWGRREVTVTSRGCRASST